MSVDDAIYNTDEVFLNERDIVYLLMLEDGINLNSLARAAKMNPARAKEARQRLEDFLGQDIFLHEYNRAGRWAMVNPLVVSPAARAFIRQLRWYTTIRRESAALFQKRIAEIRNMPKPGP